MAIARAQPPDSFDFPSTKRRPRKLANFVCEGNSGGYVLGTLAPGLMAGAHKTGSLLCSYGMLAMASCTTPLLRCTMGIVGGAAKCKLCIAAAAAAAARLWCCC